jgi:hypothetical protein
MKDFFKSPNWELTKGFGFIFIVILLIVIICTSCVPAIGQVRITGAVGAVSKPSLVGQFNISYESSKFFAGTDVVRQAIKTGTWLGIKSGYIFQLGEETGLRIYSGIQYKIVGRKHSYDRYVHNGQTEYLTTGMETNQVNVPIGVQFTKGYLFIEGGAMVGKQTTVMLTIGITQLFSRN